MTSETSDSQSTAERCAQLEQEVATLRKKLARLERIEREHAWQTAFLQQLIDLIPMGIAVNTDGVITYINPTGAALLKAESADQVLGQPAMQFIHPDFHDVVRERIRELVESDSGNAFPVASYIEEKFLCLNGDVIDVEVAGFQLQGLEIGNNSLMILFRDVTEEKKKQRMLQESEARFRQLVSLLPVATIIHKNGTILFANQTAAELLRVDSEKDIVGQRVFKFLHPDEHEMVVQRIKQLVETRKPLPMVKEKILRADGDIFVAETTAFPFVEENGDLAVLVVMHDVTEQERMLNELEKSEARFRMLAEVLPASVFIVGQDGELLYLNVTTHATLGYSTEESLSVDFFSRMDAESLQKSRQILDEVQIGENAHFELRIKDKYDNWQWLDVYITKTVMDDQIVGLGVTINATWRKETELLLKQQAQKLVRAYEEERARIARELHDEIGQQLIGMKFVLERAQHFTTSPEGLNALQSAGQILANLTEMVRELSLTFRPSQLDDLGLLATLVWHFERYTNRTGIQVNFSHSGLEDRRFSQTVEITVYRVIQESLTNVARHARANTVNVSIHADTDSIYLAITDNGVGFEPDEVMSSYISSGLSGMKERVELLGGELTIESLPGEGATITAIIPLIENPTLDQGRESNEVM